MEKPEGHEKTLVLVKALPEESSQYGETVCCAGLTPEGEWRRQFPIRYRNLSSKFKRWQWIEYNWRAPKNDPRPESRRVQEGSIVIVGEVPPSKRTDFLSPYIRISADEAKSRGETLTLIRPENPKFAWKKKRPNALKVSELLTRELPAKVLFLTLI
jgi:hypothetical protein